MTQIENLIDNIRNGKSFDQVQTSLEALADMANVPHDWKAPGSGYTLESVIQQIEDAFNVRLFRSSK